MPTGQLTLAVDLRRGPGEVDRRSRRPRSGRADLDPQRLRLVADAVDPVDEAVLAVGERGDLGPHQPLAEALQLVHVGARGRRRRSGGGCSVSPRSPARQAATCARRSPSTCTGWRVFFSMMRNSVVFSSPGVVELEQGHPQPLLVDLGRVHGDAAGRDPADVGVMRHRRRPALELAVDEDRLDHVDVGQVLAAEAVRVVGDEDVARLRRLAELLEHVAHRRRERPELDGERQPLRDHLAVAVAERGRVVHRVAHDGRVGAPHHHQRHLVGDRARARS